MRIKLQYDWRSLSDYVRAGEYDSDELEPTTVAYLVETQQAVVIADTRPVAESALSGPVGIVPSKPPKSSTPRKSRKTKT